MWARSRHVLTILQYTWHFSPVFATHGVTSSHPVSYSYSPDLDGLKLNLELETGAKKDITVDYFSARTINLAVDRNWRIGKANIFYLELGYAFPMQANRWRVTDGSAISSNSESVLNLLQPGGLILGAGFAFKIF